MQPRSFDVDSSTNIPKQKINWINLINESVHTNDDIDIGDVYAVSRNFVVVMRGLINVHYYYIPKKNVEGWDGNVLWLKVTEKYVKDNYERDILPDPGRYKIKDYTYYKEVNDNYFLLPVIPPRYVIPKPPNDQVSNKSLSTNNNPTFINTCDLCKQTLNSQDQLDKHIETQH
jgi:hypothetical protein